MIGSILRCSIPVIEGDMTRICIVVTKDKKVDLFILIASIPLHHVILLKALLCYL